jgi:hypothetical protein
MLRRVGSASILQSLLEVLVQRVHLWLRYSLKSSSHYILVVVGVVGVSERSRLVLFGPCADGAGDDEEGRWFKSRSRSGASL